MDFVTLRSRLVVLAIRICGFCKIHGGCYLEILAEYNAERPVSKLSGTETPTITVILSISLIRDDE